LGQRWFLIRDRFLEYDRTAGRVEPVGYEVRAGALQGYLIDKNTAEMYNITSLADLQDLASAKLFDMDDDGKTDQVGCNEGCGCASIVDRHIRELELSETTIHLHGNYPTLKYWM